MSHLVTLVASSPPLNAAHVTALGLHAAPQWIEPGKAATVPVPQKPDFAQIMRWRAQLAADRIDIFVTQAENRAKKLMLSDMDSTIVAEETLDEVAAHIGIGAEIAAITARTMRGELDFEESLRARVAMLKGAPLTALQSVRDAVTVNPGARALVAAMNAHGAVTVLVTGGFTYFSAHVAALTGFTYHHANTLDHDGNVLAGTVTPPVLGREAKAECLFDYCRRLNLSPSDAFAIGDGANDLPMLQAAGLGIGYRPKPLVLETIENCIIHGDLTAALYAQGLKPLPHN